MSLDFMSSFFLITISSQLADQECTATARAAQETGQPGNGPSVVLLRSQFDQVAGKERHATVATACSSVGAECLWQQPTNETTSPKRGISPTVREGSSSRVFGALPCGRANAPNQRHRITARPLRAR